MHPKSVNKHSPKSVLPEPASVVLPMKRTRVLAPCQDTAQSKQRCRTLRMTLDRSGTEERLKRSHARNRNGTSPPDDFVRLSRASSTAACRGGSQRNKSPAAWSIWPSDSAELRCLHPEILELVEPTKRSGRDRRRNGRRNVFLDGGGVCERESCELEGAVAQCLDGQFLRVRQARCPQAPEHLEKPRGLAAPFTWSLAEALGASGMVGDCVPSGGARPTFCGIVGDDRPLCTTRGAPAYEAVRSPR